jgi:hypothetical protein
VALVTGLAGAAVAAIAFTAGDSNTSAPAADEFVVSAASTIAPRSATPTLDNAGEPSAAATTVADATTVPLSPLAALLGERGNAIPEPVEPRARPRSVTIGSIELWGPIQPVGLADDGQLEIPDEKHIGWYLYGAAPGLPGATVLAAHVTWNHTVGPFYRLRDLEPGDPIEVEMDDGSVRTYAVVERALYDKDSLPRERIWRTDGDETLVLITCGGSFNPEVRRYRQNVVVYAVPVADRAVDAPPAGL